MVNNYNFSFIITYRYNPYSYFNLRKILEWVNSFSGAEIILVEQDNVSKLEGLDLNCKHIFAKNDGPFNRSWGQNIGFKFSNNKRLVFSNERVVLNHQLFIDSINALDSFDMINPYNEAINLDQNESKLPYNMLIGIIDKDPDIFHNKKREINSVCEGMSMFKSESFLKIGGWHEGFKGEESGEDKFQEYKAEKLLSYQTMEGIGYKLYTENNTQENSEITSKNEKLLNQLLTIDDNTLNKVISKDIMSGGLLNIHEV